MVNVYLIRRSAEETLFDCLYGQELGVAFSLGP